MLDFEVAISLRLKFGKMHFFKKAKKGAKLTLKTPPKRGSKNHLKLQKTQ
jgi:hypothetical protein